MEKVFRFLLFITSFLILSLVLSAQENYHRLSGFQISPYFGEQVLSLNYSNEIKIHINAPSPEKFKPEKPISIALFALPNGNTIEQTIGKILEPGDDWHFDIQHIGAQTRFLRNHIAENNLVTVYLENSQKSWPAWKAKYTNHYEIIKDLVDYIRNIFSDYENSVVLTGHSGGGRFTFSLIDAYAVIPSFVKRISFLDSNYGYENTYGTKMINWLKSSEDNYLSVIAYNDSVALYNGEPIVSATGGTWYRSRMMKKFMESDFEFISSEDSEFIKHVALSGRVTIILKKNPERNILHTVQVERNGFIQGMVSGTSYEGVDYDYYGDRAYSELIQRTINSPAQLKIPPRPSDALSGSQFMASVESLSIEAREAKVLEQISKGNIPNFLRSLTKIESNFRDANGVSHSVIYEVMPDYLAIGSDEDFCRIPMGPITAQKLADLFGAALPTSKLVDNIYSNCDTKLEPVTYPWSEQSITVSKFIEHNSAIEVQRKAAGGELGLMIGGTKKDVILSNKLSDPTRTHHVIIYGWHQLNGIPIQPIYNGHINTYMDYSHGIRFINSEMLIDSVVSKYQEILTDDVLYKILSDENGAMERTSYIVPDNLPQKPQSFGIISEDADKLRILINDEPNVEGYKIFLSPDGIVFSEFTSLTKDNLVLSGLVEDSLYFIKMKAFNQSGESVFSEVLAGIPSLGVEKRNLIVNGFDRGSTGNTYNFIKQHAFAIKKNHMIFDTATNEAVENNLLNLNNYYFVDYILGEESTADETYSNGEQTIVANYLDSGGNIFVSGAEIAWDLDHKGSSSDKSFIWNYLKMKYVADAPYEQSSTYYSVQTVSNSFFNDGMAFNFDNGTNGTYNVKYPDVLAPQNGSEGFIKYSALPTANGYAGVLYSGMFQNGIKKGKVITLGFPFETIYPESARNNFMNTVIDFVYSPLDFVNSGKGELPKKFNLAQNFPNPFNPSTTINYSIGSNRHNKNVSTKIAVYDVLGKMIEVLLDKELAAGEYSIEFNGNQLASGIYLLKMQSGDYFDTKKMILLK